MFENFYGNERAAGVLEGMLTSGRLAQTILIAGPDGVGKATLARRFATRLLNGNPEVFEQDDLSLPANQDRLAERDKLTAEKRADDPLIFQSHADFLTFCPEGPLRQLSIHQMRSLKEHAQYAPLRGKHRVFLIDQLDRANEQAANSLLKVLEEPPPYLVLIATAANAFDLLPTIRSRAVTLHLSRLAEPEMLEFTTARGLKNAERRIALAAGCPGLASTLDLAAHDKRRAAMLAMIGAAAGVLPWADWARQSDALAAARSEKLENYLLVLYTLLEDLLQISYSAAPALRHADIRKELTSLAAELDFEWIQAAVRKTDSLLVMLRRNIQRGIALDAWVIEMRRPAKLARSRSV